MLAGQNCRAASRTSMNNVLVVEVVNSLKDLLDCLGSVLFGELALVANSVKQLSTGR